MFETEFYVWLMISDNEIAFAIVKQNARKKSIASPNRFHLQKKVFQRSLNWKWTRINNVKIQVQNVKTLSN